MAKKIYLLTYWITVNFILVFMKMAMVFGRYLFANNISVIVHNQVGLFAICTVNPGIVLKHDQ
jgi:hypothetical protein